MRSRFHLRYRGADLDLPPGEFTVGRSSECSLAIADALVSRRHAVFHVDADEVIVEDTGSRNGVIVNGVASLGRRRLQHLDRIYIGSQELILVDASKAADLQFARRPRSLSGTHLFAEKSEVTKSVTSRDVIDSIASKAIVLGRYQEAERILIPHLDKLLERALRGAPLSKSEGSDSTALLARATANALELARGLAAKRWIDWVFKIHVALGLLMSEETIEALHEAVRAVGYHEARHVRTYLQAIQSQDAAWGPAERFRAQRVHGLAGTIIHGD